MKTLVLNAGQIQRKITRIAYEIYEEHAGEKEIVLAGMVKGGYLLAQKIEKVLKDISPLKIHLMKVMVERKPNNIIDITLEDHYDLKDKTVVIIDDVLNTGTVLANCLKAVLEFPVKCVNAAVLIDRNHATYPVKSDFTGLSIATTLQEHIEVDLTTAGKEQVVLMD
jgi:pyrimidine operon attenuation protein/uracil phosphoribosyltransferase